MGTVSWPEGIEAHSIDTGDADAWAELLAAKEKIDHEGENYGPQDLLDQLNDPHVDAALDTIGLWAEGRMVAYGKAHAAESVIDVDRVRTDGAVHPQWRRRGVGTALMHWLIERAAELHAVKHPDAPGEVGNSAISTNIASCRRSTGIPRNFCSKRSAPIARPGGSAGAARGRGAAGAIRHVDGRGATGDPQ